MSNLKVIVNTKGGVGKSTISNHILPVVFNEKFPDMKIVIVEIDGSNDTSLKNTELKISNNSDSLSVVKNLRFELMAETDTIYIVDVGASDDSKKLLKKLSETNLEADFYIPTNDDWEQLHNIRDTLKRVQKCNYSSINLVLNRCDSLNPKEIEEQFMNLYSLENKKERIADIEDLFSEFFYVPNIPILSMIKGKYQQFLIDNIKTQIQFKKDFAAREKELIESKSKDKYMELLDGEEMADRILKLKETVLKIFS